MTRRGPSDRLSSTEVAERLGVRLETVYAYVSRGLLHSERAGGGRGSTFDRAEVDALLDHHRRVRPTQAGSWRGPVVDTDITLIEDGRLYFRGVDAVELAAALPFEAAAEWLWTGEVGDGPWPAPAEPLAAARAAAAALPSSGDLVACLRVVVAAAASGDPLRYDVRAEAVLPTARGLLATMVEALPVAAGADDPGAGAPLAGRLWSRLTPARPSRALLACLEAALVLLLDHDLAISTVAARTAASVRANPYAVIATGLSAMEGPLHGGASTLAHAALRDVLDGDARHVVAEHLRSDRPVPGYGHRLYPDQDPRAVALLERLAAAPEAARVVDAVRRLTDAAGMPPNVDLALAALALAAGMPRDAGEVVFAVARSVGWVAHALEEYDEPPLRFRGHGRYRGPRPPQPVPGAPTRSA